jgi:hypothetical protein
VVESDLEDLSSRIVSALKVSFSSSDDEYEN